jgi:hypothetical protein
VSSLGERLVEFHLMEGIGQHGESTLEGAGSRDAAPGMPKYDVRSKRIYINKSQYVPEVDKQVWDYKIGSYNLCKKWLEVRKLRELSQEEVVRFSGILNALRSTIELEQQVDAVIDQHGGWPDAFVTTDGGAA